MRIFTSFCAKLVALGALLTFEYENHDTISYIFENFKGYFRAFCYLGEFYVTDFLESWGFYRSPFLLRMDKLHEDLIVLNEHTAAMRGNYVSSSR